MTFGNCLLVEIDFQILFLLFLGNTQLPRLLHTIKRFLIEFPKMLYFVRIPKSRKTIIPNSKARRDSHNSHDK